MIETFLIVMAIIVILCYFGIGYSLEKEKMGRGMLSLFILTLISGILLFVCFILKDQNDILDKKVKNKYPEYEEVHGLYKLKNK